MNSDSWVGFGSCRGFGVAVVSIVIGMRRHDIYQMGGQFGQLFLKIRRIEPFYFSCVQRSLNF
jgi:hypothetical protein